MFIFAKRKVHVKSHLNGGFLLLRDCFATIAISTHVVQQYSLFINPSKTDRSLSSVSTCNWTKHSCCKTDLWIFLF